MMKRSILAFLMGVMTHTAMAHAPFVVPQSYLVNGGNTGVIAGFAEQPFDSEVVIRGFDFDVVYPDGDIGDLTLVNSKTMSIADIDTAQAGTYQIIGKRIGDIKFAQQGQRWLRVLDAEADRVEPLAKRNFTIPSEITAKTPQITVKRHDLVGSYFSKKETSPIEKMIDNHGLEVQFSEHPNQIQIGKPLSLKLNLNQKPAVNYQVELEKQPTLASEKTEVIKLKSNQQGEVKLPLAGIGQYIVTITSPELNETVKPAPETHRTILSFYVNP